MSLNWYAYISMNTYHYEIYYILSEKFWWALSSASLIMWIYPAVHEILADKAFTATDVLISQSFVVTFVHPAYVQIVLIWGFLAQLGLWKSVHLLWRYKLNEVCDKYYYYILSNPNPQVCPHFIISWQYGFSIEMYIERPLYEPYFITLTFMRIWMLGIVMINTSCFTGGLLMDNRYWGYFLITQ